MPKYGLTSQGQPRDDIGKLVSKGLTLVERLWSRVEVRQAHECWLWQGAQSRGGRSVTDGGRGPQSITYGLIKESRFDGDVAKPRCWRTHQVAALLKPEVRIQVPRDEGEELNFWLRRAWRHYSRNLLLEVSHQCDTSLCCNPAHLEWESHLDNRAFQVYRQKMRAQDPSWLPVCCLPPELGGLGWSLIYSEIQEIRARLAGGEAGQGEGDRG